MNTRNRLLSVTGIAAIAAVLRVWAATDNAWIDEVSTYYLAMSIDSPMEAITRIRIDHHIMNTAFMRLVGETSCWLLYRLLSIVTGVLLIPLLFKAGSEEGTKGSLLPPLLACISFPLITYSSEARGYAPAIFFSLASYLILRHGWNQRLLIYRLLFWTLTACALLAHITSLYVLAGMSAWSAYRVCRAFREDRKIFKSEIADFAITYAPPYATLLSIYMLIMRQSTSVGGDILPPGRVLIETLACFSGFSLENPWTIIGAALTIVLLIASGVYALRINTGRGIFYITTVVIAPALTLISYEREYLYSRYFILCFPFAVLMLSDFLTYLFKFNQLRIISVLIIASFCIGNATQTARFLHTGRGGYIAALQEIVNSSANEPVIISGDHDFRVGMMTVYYSRWFKGIKYMRYIPASSLPDSGSDWYITHQQDNKIQPPAALVIGNWLYKYTSTYPYFGLSGMTWNLYKRTEPYKSIQLLEPATGAAAEN